MENITGIFGAKQIGNFREPIRKYFHDNPTATHPATHPANPA